VSLIIATFNHARFLGAAIDSALAQTLGAVDVIVVDDGSTDDTPAVLARYAGRVRVLRQPNRGLAAARNAGLAAARGTYVAFLDADDVMAPTKLAAQLEVLERFAAERGHSILELAIGWLLAHAPVTSVIAGATTPEQVQANAAAAGWVLTADEMELVAAGSPIL